MGKLNCSSAIKVELLNPDFDPNDASMPKGRSGHCMCADESNIYMFGGYSPSDERNGVRQSRVLPELWKFNFALEKWTKLATDNIPSTCASASIAVHNKQIFVFGGTGYPFGQIMSNTIKTLRLNSNSQKCVSKPSPMLQAAGEDSEGKEKKSIQKLCWHLLETNAMSYSGGGEVEDVVPPPAYGQSLIFSKNAVYVFGGAIGYYSEAVSVLHKLSINTMEWERLTPTGTPPSGRYKQEVAQDPERFYVFGGGRLYKAEGLEDIYIYHIAKNHWSVSKSLPDPKHGIPKARCSFGCAQDGMNVYISGGRHYSETVEHKALCDIWHLNLENLRWTKLDVSLPKPLYFHSSVISPSGHMYIFGGVHKDAFRSPYMYKFRLPLSMPKLAEICWYNVSKIAQKDQSLNPEILAESGVPWNFIDRIEDV